MPPILRVPGCTPAASVHYADPQRFNIHSWTYTQNKGLIKSSWKSELQQKRHWFTWDTGLTSNNVFCHVGSGLISNRQPKMMKSGGKRVSLLHTGHVCHFWGMFSPVAPVRASPFLLLSSLSGGLLGMTANLHSCDWQLSIIVSLALPYWHLNAPNTVHKCT